MSEENQEQEQLYDVLVPPGVPRKIIVEVMEKYDVQLVERSVPLSFANMDNDARDLLAFRGKKEVVAEVEKFILGKLNAFIAED